MDYSVGAARASRRMVVAVEKRNHFDSLSSVEIVRTRSVRKRRRRGGQISGTVKVNKVYEAIGGEVLRSRPPHPNEASVPAGVKGRLDRGLHVSRRSVVSDAARRHPVDQQRVLAVGRRYVHDRPAVPTQILAVLDIDRLLFESSGVSDAALLIRFV